MRRRNRFLIAALAVGLTAAGLAGLPVEAGGDWPRFRGPGGDGISTETGLLDHWPDGGPAVAWRKPLGEGYFFNDTATTEIYTMFGEKKDEFTVCLDAATGEEIWRRRAGAKWVDNMGNGPRSTPTVDGDAVYVLSSKGNLQALAVDSGEVRWSRDLAAEYGAAPPRWGVSTSVLIEGEMLLLDIGGKDGSSIVALNKKSGKEIWRSQTDGPGYSMPIVVTVNDLRQALFFTATKLVSVAPKDGSLFWSVPWKTSYDVNAAMPVFIAPDRVFISSGYDKGALLLRIIAGEGKAVAEELWRTREMKNHFSSSVLHEGNLYGFDDKTLKCIDAGSGEPKWRKRGFGHGTLLLADGHFVVLGDHGQLALIEANPAEYVERGSMEVSAGKTWTMPTLWGGRLYVRDENELVVVDVSAPARTGKKESKLIDLENSK
jgi:outer membrane protein assembly factor BamB